MSLSEAEIKHIANLARLELTSDELKKYGDQLSGILAYIDQLKEVDTTGVTATAQITGLENILREDEVEAWDKEELNDALRQAPDTELGQIKVKRVLG